MWARDIRFLTFGWCLAIACGKSGSEHDARRHQPGSGGASAAAGAASGGSSKGGASGAGSGGTAADGGAGGGAGSPEGGEPGAGAGGAGGDGDCAPAEPVVITSEAELRAFAARRCETLEGSLTVRSPTLRSLDALLPSSTLRLVTGDLVLDQNPVLENVHGLSGLREIGGSFIVTASHLENLDGLETVRSIGRSSDTDALVLGDNPLLANVAALGGLNRWLTSLIVTNNAELGSLAGLDRLATTNNVTIANNASLEEIGGLTELASSENLTVAANPNLLTVSLPNLEEAGSLNVTSNNALGSVSFPLLVQAGTLTIAGNPALNNVGPLSTLVSVDLLVIASNPMLPQCFVDALDARLQACNMSCGGNDTSAMCN